MQLDDELCLCFHVTKRKILNYLRVHKPRVPSQLSACGSAGTGCGWCVPVLKRYFEQAADQRGRDAGVEGESQSSDQYARDRARYLLAGKGVAPPGATPPPPLDR